MPRGSIQPEATRRGRRRSRVGESGGSYAAASCSSKAPHSLQISKTIDGQLQSALLGQREKVLIGFGERVKTERSEQLLSLCRFMQLAYLDLYLAPQTALELIDYVRIAE